MTTVASGRPNTGTDLMDRVPPQSLEAEMSLLGSMLLNRDAIGEVISVIAPHEVDWFYRPDHRILFDLLVKLYDKQAPVDLVVVREALAQQNQLEEVGGVAYLVELAESVPTWVNASHYAQLVRDKGILRDLIRCCGQITDSAYHAAEDAKLILDKAEQSLFDVTERRVTGQPVPVRELVEEAARQLESRDSMHVTGLETGFAELDDVTSGLQPGDLIIVAGRPSMGKTAFGLNVAEHIAITNEKPAVFFSMEMSRQQVVQRLLCSRARVDSQRFRKRMCSEEEIKHLLDACALMETAPLYIDDTPGMTIMELRAKVRRLRQLHRIEAVFVDYMQLMHQPQAESRQQEIATISRGLKSLGRELNIPIIAMAQLNRMAEGRSDHRPRMGDLRESGAIEQDADVIMLIHREEYYKPQDPALQGLAELSIAKQRNGPTANIKLHFNRQLTRFDNLSHTPEPGGEAPYEQDAPF